MLQPPNFVAKLQNRLQEPLKTRCGDPVLHKKARCADSYKPLLVVTRGSKEKKREEIAKHYTRTEKDGQKKKKKNGGRMGRKKLASSGPTGTPSKFLDPLRRHTGFVDPLRGPSSESEDKFMYILLHKEKKIFW